MSESENEDYQEKDIVWAKINGYLWWPSLISQISFKQPKTLGKTQKEKIYTIELIGEKTNMKVSSEIIEPFLKNYDKHANTKDSSLLIRYRFNIDDKENKNVILNKSRDNSRDNKRRNKKKEENC